MVKEVKQEQAALLSKEKSAHAMKTLEKEMAK